MGSVHLFAIAITEVRDIFSAPPELAARLRATAAREFGAQERTPTQGLLGKLGPVFTRQPDAVVVRPDVPSGSDVEHLLAGRFVPPHRLESAWRLLEAWLVDLSWGETSTDLAAGDLPALDFDLAKAGVAARFGVGDLIKGDLGLALRPAPRLAAGYLSFGMVGALADAWRPVVDELEPDHQVLVRGLLNWLDGFPGWADQASAENRQPPDLVALLRS